MKQITSSLYQLSLGPVNAFIIDDSAGLIDDNAGITLIDTGLKGSTDKIFSALEKDGKSPGDIRRIILTHAHSDHAGSAAELKKRLNIPVFAHVDAVRLIEAGLSIDRPVQRSPGLANLLIYNLFIRSAGNTIDPLTIDQHFNDNDILPFAGGIQVIYTPGHAKGHISLLLKQERVLIAGDICAHAFGLAGSTVYEDRQLGIQSILKAASLDFDTAVFGHGRPLQPAANKKLKEKFSSTA